MPALHQDPLFRCSPPLEYSLLPASSQISITAFLSRLPSLPLPLVVSLCLSLSISLSISVPFSVPSQHHPSPNGFFSPSFWHNSFSAPCPPLSPLPSPPLTFSPTASSPCLLSPLHHHITEDEDAQNHGLQDEVHLGPPVGKSREQKSEDTLARKLPAASRAVLGI